MQFGLWYSEQTAASKFHSIILSHVYPHVLLTLVKRHKEELKREVLEAKNTKQLHQNIDESLVRG